jgi:hypothetical protein
MKKLALCLVLSVGCGTSGMEGETFDEVDAVGGADALELESVISEVKTKPHQTPKKQPLEVTFHNCSEFAGLTYVPLSKVRHLVPSRFSLAQPSPSQAIVVVRVADCEGIRVKNGVAKPGTVAQVGVNLVGPDATSDINNYTLWYVTNNQKLSTELLKYSVEAEYSPYVGYEFAPGFAGVGPFDVAVSASQAPNFVLEGTAAAPTDPAVPFVASWWTDTCEHTVQMRTTLPSIRFSGSQVTLTALGTRLRNIVGNGPVTFPGLDSYNTFNQATMIVSAN